MNYLESLDTRSSNNIMPLELIKATEDKEIWKHVIADVVFDNMVP